MILISENITRKDIDKLIRDVKDEIRQVVVIKSYCMIDDNCKCLIFILVIYASFLY